MKLRALTVSVPILLYIMCEEEKSKRRNRIQKSVSQANHRLLEDIHSLIKHFHKIALFELIDRLETRLFAEEDALLREEKGSTRYEIKRRRLETIQKRLTKLQDELDSFDTNKSS